MRLVSSFPARVRRPRKALVRGDLLYVSSYGDDCVACLRWPQCDRVERVLPVRRARGMAFFRDRLFVASYGNPVGAVSCFDVRDGRLLFRVRSHRPRGLVCVGEELFVTEVNRNRVLVLSVHDGRRLRRLRGGFAQPRGIDADADGNLVVADSGHDRVVCLTRHGRRLWTRCGFARPNDVVCAPRLVVSEWAARRVADRASRCALPGQPTMLGAWRDVLLVCDDLLHEIHLVAL